ncbi:MAG: ABC transporter permease [Chloroflexi bacterium]|nr:ABC transporter permease [Chloroflexota bacterium]
MTGLSTTMSGSGQRRIMRSLAEYGFVVMFFLWAVYLTLATDNFATTDNIFTILRQAAIIGITAIGAHFVILMGDMDLSAAAVISLSGVVMGEAMVNQGFAPIPAALAALVVGALVGLANGLIVTQLRINAIITTLGTSSILSGIAFTITQGKTIYGERGNDPIDKIEFLSRNRVLGDWVPVPVIILFACYIIAFIVLRYTAYGARVYAVGNNERAAWLSGIKVDRIRIATFVVAGALAGFAGIMQVARQGTATAGMGADFLFPILTAVVLGGASLRGGRGKVFSTLVAAIFLTSINNGMVLLGIDIYTQNIVSGVILVVALSMDRLRTLRL